MFPEKKICCALGTISLCLISLLAYGQDQATINDFDLKAMLPTSPEAAVLGKFGDIPVGHYTGTADISIPLYTIEEGGLQVPIILRYHSSGIKVEEEASNVGLGWLLEPGGAIIQVVNGAPDHADHLVTSDGYQFMKSRIPVSGDHSTRHSIGTFVFEDCIVERPCPLMQCDTRGTIIDLMFNQYGQPDIYQYSFPGGYSGKFYRNPETSEIVIIDQNEKISFTGDMDGWIATTLDGHRFYFDEKEYSYAAGNNYNSGYTWKLSKILLNSGREINFTYEDGFHQSHIRSETFQTRIKWDSSNPYPQIYSNYTNHYTKRLSNIETPLVNVNFNYSDRDDLWGHSDNDGDDTNGVISVKKLNSVSVINATDGVVKSFVFNYDYFTSNIVGGNLVGVVDPRLEKRLKLLSVQENGYDNQGQAVPKPAHRFEYNESGGMPHKFSAARDFWGYYNGVNNNNLLPDLSYFHYVNDLPENWPAEEVYFRFTGAIRFPDQDKMQAGILKKITYPTGGSTSFEYEPHTYSNYKYPLLSEFTANRKIIDITDRNEPGIIPTSRFAVNKKQKVKIHNRLSRGSDISLDYDDIAPSAINLYRVSNGSSSLVKKWQMTTSDRQSFDTNGSMEWEEYIWLEGGPGVEFILSVDLNGAIGYQGYTKATAWSNLKYFETDDETSHGKGAGLRLNKVINYDENDLVTGTKVYKYVTEAGGSSGLLMSKLALASKRSIKYVFDHYTSPLTEEEWFLSSESFTPFSTAAQGNAVGYSRVEETAVDGSGNTLGRKVFTYYNTESETHEELPEGPHLNNGLLRLEQVFNSEDDLLTQIAFEYAYRDSKTFTGTKARQLHAVIACANDNEDLTHEANGFLYMHYPINSTWYYPTHKITTTNSEGIQHVVREDYDYNNFGQQDEVTSTTSTGKSTVVKTLFAKNTFDGETTTTGEQFADGELLYNNKLFDLPLEKRYFVDDVLQYKTLYFYDEIGGQVVNTRIERVFGAGAAFNVVSFDKYGPNKTLREVTQKGIKSSLIYDNTNSYVIASASNAASTEIAYTSFEPQESGGWTFSDSKTNKLTARTGSWQYALNTNAVSYSGLSSGKKYIVSYWSQNSSPYTVSGTVGTAAKLMTADGWNYFEHTITGVTQVTVSGSGFLDELRLHPADAQMTSYTSEPLKGVSSVSDPASRAAFFDFDANGRLETMRGNSKEVMKVMDYHYSTN